MNITEDDVTRWGPFDFLIGGSPCNDFSLVNPHREGFAGRWGKLFFEYARSFVDVLEMGGKKSLEDLV